MLWVALAGGVRVEVDGDAVDVGSLGSRQGRQLLARLAWEGRPVHRDELADGIWIDSLPRTWERTLSGVVTRLRRGLSDAGIHGEVITHSDGRYGLVGGGDVRVDVHDARATLRAAWASAEVGDLAGARDLIETVLRVARQPLLPGDDAAWVDLARVRHHALLIEALDGLADVGLRAGWYGLAEEAARESLHWEPLRESGHQRLMRTLAASGDSAAAVVAYAACRQVLADELAVRPSAETDAVYREVLGVDPDTAPSAMSGRTTALQRAPFPTSLAAYSTVLIGRDAALVSLWSFWHRARTDSPLTVVVHGPEGAGKRSLVGVFAREVYAAGGAVVHRYDVVEDHSAVGESAPTAAVSATLAIVEVADAESCCPPVGGAALVVLIAETPPPGGAIALEVGPLDPASVEMLAEERLGRSPREGELESLRRTTGGWVGALVDTLARWTEDRARLLAEEAAAADSSLRAAHDDIAAEILRGQTRRTYTDASSGDDDPYKGLLRFEPEDVDLYFGRERLVADILARVAADAFITVVGASGSGKSSLLRAGVTAQLRRGALAGSESWPIVLMTPGRSPMRSLISCLSAATDRSIEAPVGDLFVELDRRSPSVIVVDQLEELFTLGSTSSERTAFVTALLSHLPAGSLGRRVLVAVRADFYQSCNGLEQLSSALTRSQIVVTSPTELELRRIISSPARRVGGLLEAGLIEQVVDDARAAPGALPLVSTALLEVWRRRTGSIMTLDAYRAAGGVSGAIATLAEDVWSGLDPADQRRTRSIFLRLAGTETIDVGRAVHRDELGAPDDDVLARLVRRRLLTLDEGTVRLAHEALLREWPRLRHWLAESRAVGEGLGHLRQAASDWDRRGRDQADLYRGPRLAAAADVAADIELTPLEWTFLDASTEREQSEVRSLKRRTSRLRVLSSTLVVLALLASAAGVIAIRRQHDAERQATIAISQRLVREADTVNGLDLRLLLAVEAHRLDDTPETRGALFGQLTRASSITGFIRADTGNLSTAALSPDGSLLALGDVDGTISVWRVTTRTPLGSASILEGPITALAFSPDGELAAGGQEGDVATWRIGDAAPTARFAAHTDAVMTLVVQRDGGLLTAGRDRLLRSFDPRSHVERWSVSLPPSAVGGSFDRDGSRYAQFDAGGGLAVFDLDEPRTRLPEIDPLNVRPTTLALSADGRLLALGDQSGGVHLVDVDAGTTVALGRLAAQDALDGTSTEIEHVAFTATGSVVATAGGVIGSFSPRGIAGPAQLIAGHVTGLAVDPMGQSAAAVTETGETVLFQLDRSSLGRVLSNAGQPVIDLAVGTGGSVIASGDGQVAVLDLSSDGRRVITVPGQPVTSVSTAGGLLAVGGRNVFRGGGGPFGSYTVVDLGSGEVLLDVTPSVPVTTVALRGDGALLAVGDEDGHLQLVDVESGQRLNELGSLPGAVAAVAFIGEELLGVAADGTVVRWDADGRPRGESISLEAPASALSIAPDGQAASVATASGAVIVDLTTGSVGGPMASPFGAVESVSFGYDGTLLATGGSGRVLLWDVQSGRRLGVPLPVNGSTTVSFDETGRRLITGASDGEVIVWEIDPQHWVEAACELAGRTLTQSEWRRYLGERSYEPACR